MRRCVHLDRLVCIFSFCGCTQLLWVIPCPRISSFCNWFDKPIWVSFFFNLIIFSRISHSSLITWRCIVLWCVILPERQIVDKIKNKQATFLCAFVPGVACCPSWGRLVGRGHIETRQRGDDELEHHFQENDTQRSPLLSHTVLTVRLMLFMRPQMFQLLPSCTSMSILSMDSFLLPHMVNRQKELHTHHNNIKNIKVRKKSGAIITDCVN